MALVLNARTSSTSWGARPGLRRATVGWNCVIETTPRRSVVQAVSYWLLGGEKRVARRFSSVEARWRGSLPECWAELASGSSRRRTHSKKRRAASSDTRITTECSLSQTLAQ